MQGLFYFDFQILTPGLCFLQIYAVVTTAVKYMYSLSRVRTEFSGFVYVAVGRFQAVTWPPPPYNEGQRAELCRRKNLERSAAKRRGRWCHIDGQAQLEAVH